MSYLFHLYRHIEYPSYVAVAVMEMNFERIDINQCPLGTLQHIRRRINTEENAKVVAAAWGTEVIQFLAVLAVSCTKTI